MKPQYKLEGRRLFVLNSQTDTYKHAAIVPLRFRTLDQAVAWFKRPYKKETK